MYKYTFVKSYSIIVHVISVCIHLHNQCDNNYAPLFDYLQAKLKPHIHDPNAPELVHFLFTPLSLVVEASKDPRHGTPDIAARVLSPMLTVEAKELLLNCLSSKETSLWNSLGDAWTLSRFDLNCSGLGLVHLD